MRWCTGTEGSPVRGLLEDGKRVLRSAQVRGSCTSLLLGALVEDLKAQDSPVGDCGNRDSGLTSVGRRAVVMDVKGKRLRCEVVPCPHLSDLERE